MRINFISELVKVLQCLQCLLITSPYQRLSAIMPRCLVSNKAFVSFLSFFYHSLLRVD